MCIATHPMLYGYQMQELERKYASACFDYSKPQTAGWMAEKNVLERSVTSNGSTEKSAPAEQAEPSNEDVRNLIAGIKQALGFAAFPRVVFWRVA
ncbi:MAG: hypothetical protein AAF412_01675 [Pseudomonadota bacterium]